MLTACGAGFHQEVIDVALKREAPMAQIAEDFGLALSVVAV